MRLDRRGDMGVATMMIFIAIVLVASVASSVLIITANNLREQAMRTGSDAIAAVSTGYEMEYVTGDVAGNEVVRLHVHLRPVPGSPDIDVSGVMVSLTVSSKSRSTSADLACGPKNTVERGDRVELIISGLSVCPGDKVTIIILPPIGFQTCIEIVVPDVLMPGTVNLR